MAAAVAGFATSPVRTVRVNDHIMPVVLGSRRSAATDRLPFGTLAVGQRKKIDIVGVVEGPHDEQ